jgi:hypothetical protein
MSEEIEEFASDLVREVREIAVSSCLFLAEGGVSGAAGRRWDGQIGTEEARAVVVDLVPDIVDLTLFALLDAIDTGRLKLHWQSSDSVSPLNLEDIGHSEMAGSFIFPDGWRRSYASTKWNEI